MTDDIVTLLRKYQPYNKLHGQAADEIERLRAKLAKADNEIEWWSRVAIEQQRMKWEAMDRYA